MSFFFFSLRFSSLYMATESRVAYLFLLFAFPAAFGLMSV